MFGSFVRHSAPNTDAVPEVLWTTEQAAAYLQVDPRLLAGWRSRRTGPPAVRVGPRLLRYRKADLDAWIEEWTERAA